MGCAFTELITSTRLSNNAVNNCDGPGLYWADRDDQGSPFEELSPAGMGRSTVRLPIRRSSHCSENREELATQRGRAAKKPPRKDDIVFSAHAEPGVSDGVL